MFDKRLTVLLLIFCFKKKGFLKFLNNKSFSYSKKLKANRFINFMISKEFLTTKIPSKTIQNLNISSENPLISSRKLFQ